ncbi:regulatory protein, luxR family [Chryseobacterium taichungense]|uniref:Regulatory protein, luxR family n=1 Tax=Chryseobacterium taichungense TaxID=295069 RepID=A0A1H7XPR0_9FLAO|nr:hypothetical protein [Chryseobacterium taichungense]SEM34979.1 regulatory protein, luxR family [Chryseobacterium taichungense]
MKNVRLAFLFILFFNSLIYSQSQKNHDEFKNKVKANSKLFTSDINKAYSELNSLIKASRILKDSLSEMQLLEKKCRYFYNKNLVDSLIISSEELHKASDKYKNVYYEAMANVYIAETYSVNKLYDKAIIHLNNAYSILKQDQSDSKKIFYAKANVLSSFANVYLDKGEPRNAAKKILEEIKSGKQIKEKSEFEEFQYLNYSNLSSIYAEYNLDSAFYFAKKSIEIRPTGISEEKSMISNFTVIGKYYKKRKEYEKSIINFHKALKISRRTGIELNINDTYKSLHEIYRETGRKDSADFYENKIKQNDLQMLQSKYNSLQEVMNKDEEEQNKKLTLNFFILGISILIVLAISVFFYVRLKKKKVVENNQNLHDLYQHLIALLQNNDPGFMFAFENAFPEFSDKLLKINPELQQSEIEFCALLKLKLTTKEIAKYTFIETRTVQNKKYRIRKKLEIPQSVDIYNWIDNI